jgi:hypothetical protein
METVIAVKPLPEYQLQVEFNTGHVKLFDVKPYLSKGIFSRLRDETLFDQAHVAYDTVCWPGNLDIAPATLFDRGVAVQPQ